MEWSGLLQIDPHGDGPAHTNLNHSAVPVPRSVAVPMCRWCVAVSLCRCPCPPAQSKRKQWPPVSRDRLCAAANNGLRSDDIMMTSCMLEGRAATARDNRDVWRFTDSPRATVPPQVHTVPSTAYQQRRDESRMPQLVGDTALPGYRCDTNDGTPQRKAQLVGDTALPGYRVVAGPEPAQFNSTPVTAVVRVPFGFGAEAGTVRSRL